MGDENAINTQGVHADFDRGKKLIGIEVLDIYIVTYYYI
jgi:hypothetical protein